MKKIIFALTIILSLISCTTEEVNTEPKRVYTVKYNSSEAGTTEDFMCEEGYILTEKELPDLHKQYHNIIWEKNGGTKITKGYKVTSNLVLTPKFEWDTQHYRYFLRAGDFYIDDKGIKCSRPNGELISSVNPNSTSEYNNVVTYGNIHAEIGGQTTLLLCDLFIGKRDFQELNQFVQEISGYDGRDVSVTYWDSKKQGFNQYSIIEEHSLYTNIDIDFSHTFRICAYKYHDAFINTDRNGDMCIGESAGLLLKDNNTHTFYEMYINPDGCLYAINPVDISQSNYPNTFTRVILEMEASEEWTGDWNKEDNINAPKIYKVKFNDIIIRSGDKSFLNFDYMNGILNFGLYYSPAYPYPMVAGNYTFDLVDTDVYLELWYFD